MGHIVELKTVVFAPTISPIVKCFVISLWLQPGAKQISNIKFKIYAFDYLIFIGGFALTV